jgi:hypothetical protein
MAENSIDFSSAEANHAIPPALFNKISELCNENEITPASFFNAIHSAYICKKYDVESFTMGVPVLNRTTPDELNTIGLYMHLVPLVVRAKNDSFIDNAKRIEDSQMNLFRHQKFTQTDIQNLLKENNIEINQLFDTVSDFQEFPYDEDYEMRILYSNYLSIPVEMHLQTFDETNRVIDIRYRTSHFNDNEAKAMIDIATKQIVPAVIRYTTVLADSINSVKKACPEAPVSVQVSLLKETSKCLEETKVAMNKLQEVTEKAFSMKRGMEQARYYRDEVNVAMRQLREPVDKLEMIVDKSMWPMPSYGDLIFEV